MNLLFISDSSITNPILSSQGLPHLHYFAKQGNKIYFLSLEIEHIENYQEKYDRIIAQYGSDIKFLIFKPLLPIKFIKASIQVLLFGFFQVICYVFRYRIDIIHARSYIPAIVSLLIKIFTGKKILFDMRGLVIDECLSQGILKETSITTRIMRFLEKKSILLSDSIVVVSQKFKEYLIQLPYINNQIENISITVVPNCVDLTKFACDEEFRRQFRKSHRLEGKNVLVYSGSLASWQQSNEMIRFYSEYQNTDHNAFLFILTFSNSSIIEEMLTKYQIEKQKYLVLSIYPDEIPKYLSVGDAGLLFRQQGLFSKVSSPLKFAEYLASGLPVIITEGVGDFSDIAEQYGVGYIVNIYSNIEILRNECKHVYEYLKKPKRILHNNCRQIAENLFSLEFAIKEYDKVYKNIMS